jgi:hypothetical protein
MRNVVRPGKLILDAGLLGRKRGIFVLVADEIAGEDSAMNTRLPGPPSQETTRTRRIRYLVFLDCEILDLCGPFDAFYYGPHVAAVRRTNEPGYECDVLAATPGRIRNLFRRSREPRLPSIDQIMDWE